MQRPIETGGGGMNYDYRVDISFRGEVYKVEFPEYWLALRYTEIIQKEKEVESVYILERMSDDEFDITRKIK